MFCNSAEVATSSDLHIFFAKFSKKHLPPACNFIQKETPTQVFSCELCEIFKNTFFAEYLWTTTSNYGLITANTSNVLLTETRNC